MAWDYQVLQKFIAGDLIEQTTQCRHVVIPISLNSRRACRLHGTRQWPRERRFRRDLEKQAQHATGSGDRQFIRTELFQPPIHTRTVGMRSRVRRIHHVLSRPSVAGHPMHGSMCSRDSPADAALLKDRPLLFLGIG